VTIWVSTAAASSTLTATLYTTSSTGATLATLGTVTLSQSPFTCSGYQQMAGSITLPSSTVRVASNGKINLKITNSGAASVTLAYDASESGTPSGRYQSALVLGSSS
jgi:hypothetical protein